MKIQIQKSLGLEGVIVGEDSEKERREGNGKDTFNRNGV